ncbi:hypothetical protein [Streptomyces sp. GS7]|uniref:hypothetical protein n=1 Tax=Streptomyces sp. GS7 TaxID=2692234 RepID=UPI0013187BB8|nr:hypothetical protein [Streptomyces sp. GS7]QHC20120.1 hypothetical protein GR130_00345 [Streptomyces sp. GS7]
MTAGTAMAVDVRATPAARPDEPKDDHAANPPLAVGHAMAGYPGRPRVPVRLLDFPSADDLRDLPDHLFALPGTLPGFSHHPGGPFLFAWRRHHPHHPFGPHLHWPPYFALDLTDRDADPRDADRSEPANPPAAAPSRQPAPSSAPVPRRSPARTDPGAAPARPEQPSTSRDRDRAGPLPSPYRPLPSPEQAPDAAGPAPAESPYALDAPAARVERVLPMGAGMALTGLGLAFLALRLRRR